MKNGEFKNANDKLTHTKFFKQKKGITLIALVITIIVLLILAGISISMLSGENPILSRAGDAKTQTENKSKEEQIKLEVLGSFGTDGKIDVATLKTNLEKIGATISGNNLPLAVTLGGQEFTVDINGDVKKAGNTPVSSFGYNSVGNYFLGKKSIGKSDADEDNTQTTNWDSSENGYKFTAGHFVHITNYSGLLWDEATNGLQEKTGADVYLCWDDNYGTINSKQDLIDYANNNGVVVYWDIFDASSGAWLSNEVAGLGGLEG